jgi:hypothetical protein
MTPNRRLMNIFKVAQGMTRGFYKAMCGPWSQGLSIVPWSGSCDVGSERFEVFASVGTYSAGSGAPREQATNVVLSATAPVWLPGIPAEQVFAYLCDVSRRGEWDSLANTEPIQQEGHFVTGEIPGNTVSLLRIMVSLVCTYSANFENIYLLYIHLSLLELKLCHDILRLISSILLSTASNGLQILIGFRRNQRQAHPATDLCRHIMHGVGLRCTG